MDRKVPESEASSSSHLPAPPIPTATNVLSNSFSGDALTRLETLGVQSYAAAQLKQDILRTVQDDSEAKETADENALLEEGEVKHAGGVELLNSGGEQGNRVRFGEITPFAGSEYEKKITRGTAPKSRIRSVVPIAFPSAPTEVKIIHKPTPAQLEAQERMAKYEAKRAKSKRVMYSESDSSDTESTSESDGIDMYDSDSDTGQKEDMWSCAQCTFSNDKNRVKCRMCKATCPQTSSSSSSSRSQASSSSSQMQVSDDDVGEIDLSLPRKQKKKKKREKRKQKKKEKRRNHSSDDDVDEDDGDVGMNGIYALDDEDDSDLEEILEETRSLRSLAADATVDNVIFDGGYCLPGTLWDRLFRHQKISIKWLWELHCQKVGGIVADEMGLGKTIQIIVFLTGLYYSRLKGDESMYDKPTLILCPATVMSHWLNEFRQWAPDMNCVLMHASGGSSKTYKQIIQSAFRRPNSVVITTYQSARIEQDMLLQREWGYVILDEGHKIRNPDADITFVCKQLLSVHRIVLTGAPVQNRLDELWSLFDFVYPGKLGTLPVFETEFCEPINRGGYTNATAVQAQTAFKCALTLRDLIAPYILRRTKADVAKHMPTKTEQVLFCDLTQVQKDEYNAALNSRDVISALNKKGSLLKAIGVLRKICNHPHLLDLVTDDKGKKKPPNRVGYGDYKESGKMLVLKEILKTWYTQGHRVLLFTQTRQMSYILEKFIRQEEYSYCKLDGTTAVKRRPGLIREFNEDKNMFLMLLTTRAGGLGINLTGANRVVLFDPDWNPATDMQAQERVYRLGQTQDVTIYRLVTRGTIEEKVYHRQIFKTLLTNKILTNPKQQRLFNSAELKELFAYQPSSNQANTGRLQDRNMQRGQANESSQLFSHIPSAQVEPAPKAKKKSKKKDKTVKIKKQKEQMKSSGGKDDNDAVLSMLMANKQVVSAFNNDSIIGSKTLDYTVAETVANSVAKSAVAALKHSRRLLSDRKVGQPTWTGRRGSVGVGVGGPREDLMSQDEDDHPDGPRLPPPPRTKRFGNKFRNTGAPSASSSLLMQQKKRKQTDDNKMEDGATISRKVKPRLHVTSTAVSSNGSIDLTSDDAPPQALVARPSTNPAGPLRSSDLIRSAVMREVADVKTSAEIFGQDPTMTQSRASRGDINVLLAEELFTYLDRNPQGVTSDDVISKFQPKIDKAEKMSGNKQVMHTFRQTLRRLASLHKRKRRPSLWKLKDDPL